MNTGNLTSTQVGHTADIVSAFVSHNSIKSDDLPGLIRSVHDALVGANDPPVVPVVEPRPEPKVSIRKSITPSAIICLDCGQSFKSIKRHLWMAHDLSPEDYRARWSLPADYPLVAAEYSNARSELAKSIGLGRKPGPLVKKSPTTRRVL